MRDIMVIKRDGRIVPFDWTRIHNAICSAMERTQAGVDTEVSSKIAQRIMQRCTKMDDNISVEEIQDMVENSLMASSRKDAAKQYIIYREGRSRARRNTIDNTIDEIVANSNDYWNTENSNKDAALATTQRDYIAGAVSTDISRRRGLPRDIIEAHDEGIIHFHDMDYFLQPIYNCCLINLEDMLQNGTVISKTKIDKPHKFSTACNIATQIIAQVASSQYGGQSISLAHLSPFVNETRQQYKHMGLSRDMANKLVKKDIEAGVQTLQYQIITLMTTNGQAPFITVYMNLAEVQEGQARDDLALVIEQVLKQRIKGVKNESGVYITPAFPKLIYALDDMNVKKDSKYYDLTVLAAKCAAKRLVPDFISNKIQRELKNGDMYTCMGCRSFLTPDRTTKNYAKAMNYSHDKNKYYGRFNQGVVTLNLVDVACSSGRNEQYFWKLMDERTELCHKALKCRHKKLLGTSSNIAPILWQHGAIARLDKDEKIDDLLLNGYSTISLGYAGLYECTMYMIGKSHTTDDGKQFALKVMQYMNDKCNKWKAEENIDYSVYGTPLETTTYKFAKCLKKRFGEIEEVTDHDYITNSYHINVREKVDAFTKLKFESQFQKLSPGGAISYVEIPNMQNNIEAVMSLIDYIYENIMYAELNTKSDYCQCCGFSGEIQIVQNEHGKLDWKCPNCGNMDHGKLNIARRTCGYIGSNFWNQGRTQEIKERVLHL